MDFCKVLHSLLTFIFTIVIVKCIPDDVSFKKSLTLTDNNWKDVLTGEWILEFKAPWCPACKNFADTWEMLAQMKDEFGLDVADVDVTVNPVLSGRFFVTSLPTIYHVKDGVFRQYVGARDTQNLIDFLHSQLWKDIEPVEWYFDPTYPHMACVGFLFKISMFVREFYNTMVEDYGIPEWTCYVIFAVVVIIIGLLLGLVFVLICDFIFPPRRATPLPPRPRDDDDGNDIVDDSPQAGDGDVPSSLRKRIIDSQPDPQPPSE